VGRRQLGRPRRRWGIILKWIFRSAMGRRELVALAKDRDMWRVLVNVVRNFGFHNMWGIS
jgi:hypothetical protein